MNGKWGGKSFHSFICYIGTVHIDAHHFTPKDLWNTFISGLSILIIFGLHHLSSPSRFFNRRSNLSRHISSSLTSNPLHYTTSQHDSWMLWSSSSWLPVNSAGVTSDWVNDMNLDDDDDVFAVLLYPSRYKNRLFSARWEFIRSSLLLYIILTL